MTDNVNYIYEKALSLKTDDNITIKEYLKHLLITLWREAEGFSGKRPFGNSGWEYDLYKPLLKEKLVKGAIDSYGDIEWIDTHTADIIIEECIRAVFDDS